MNRAFLGFLLLSATVLFPASCTKNAGDVSGEVELYLLESYETDGSCEIIKSSVETSHKPLVRYGDFKSYNAKNHFFKITDSAKEAVQGLQHSVNGLPFAVMADDQLIYTGYFWPAYSSASCQWIVIDPMMLYGDNKLRVELGYPGPIDGIEIPDERNHPLILDIFRRDGKLIE